MGQVGLVEEADLGRDVGQGLAGEDPVAGSFQPAADDVGVRGDAEGGREASGEVGRAHAEDLRRGGDRDGLEEVVVQVGAEGLDGRIGGSRIRALLCALADAPITRRIRSATSWSRVSASSESSMQARARSSSDTARRRPVSGIAGRSTADPIRASPTTAGSR